MRRVSASTGSAASSAAVRLAPRGVAVEGKDDVLGQAQQFADVVATSPVPSAAPLPRRLRS